MSDSMSDLSDTDYTSFRKKPAVKKAAPKKKRRSQTTSGSESDLSDTNCSGKAEKRKSKCSPDNSDMSDLSDTVYPQRPKKQKISSSNAFEFDVEAFVADHRKEQEDARLLKEEAALLDAEIERDHAEEKARVADRTKRKRDREARLSNERHSDCLSVFSNWPQSLPVAYVRTEREECGLVRHFCKLSEDDETEFCLESMELEFTGHHTTTIFRILFQIIAFFPDPEVVCKAYSLYEKFFTGSELRSTTSPTNFAPRARLVNPSPRWRPTLSDFRGALDAYGYSDETGDDSAGSQPDNYGNGTTPEFPIVNFSKVVELLGLIIETSPSHSFNETDLLRMFRLLLRCSRAVRAQFARFRVLRAICALFVAAEDFERRKESPPLDPLPIRSKSRRVKADIRAFCSQKSPRKPSKVSSKSENTVPNSQPDISRNSQEDSQESMPDLSQSSIFDSPRKSGKRERNDVEVPTKSGKREQNDGEDPTKSMKMERNDGEDPTKSMLFTNDGSMEDGGSYVIDGNSMAVRLARQLISDSVTISSDMRLMLIGGLPCGQYGQLVRQLASYFELWSCVKQSDISTAPLPPTISTINVLLDSQHTPTADSSASELTLATRVARLTEGACAGLARREPAQFRRVFLRWQAVAAGIKSMRTEHCLLLKQRLVSLVNKHMILNRAIVGN
eukprot:718891_1